MGTSEFFSGTYQQARSKFIEAARATRAEISSHRLPNRQGPDGSDLFVDVASLRTKQQQNVLIVISGTHGVEGLCGSGCQTGILLDDVYRGLSQDVGMLLIHALNPYGFAWLRRVTEDNVDLNRNFRDFSRPLPSSAAYEEIHDALVPVDWDGSARQEADAAIEKHIQVHGLRSFQAAVTGGQYSRPNGLFFGGTRETWSNITFRKIMAKVVEVPTEKIVILDIHTGLGPSGYGEPIYVGSDLAEYLRAIKCVGPEVTSTIKGDSSASQVSGTLADAINGIAVDTQCTFLALEYGTIPSLDVLTALRAENWFNANAPSSDPRREQIKKQIRDAFYVDEAWWKAAVYGRTVDIFLRAGRALV